MRKTTPNRGPNQETTDFAETARALGPILAERAAGHDAEGTFVADNYEDEVDNAVAGITSVIEPILIVFLAVIVGTIVIALFLPLISIIQNLSG